MVIIYRASLIAQCFKDSICSEGDPGLIPGWKDPLEQDLGRACGLEGPEPSHRPRVALWGPRHTGSRHFFLKFQLFFKNLPFIFWPHCAAHGILDQQGF